MRKPLREFLKQGRQRCPVCLLMCKLLYGLIERRRHGRLLLRKLTRE